MRSSTATTWYSWARSSRHEHRRSTVLPTACASSMFELGRAARAAAAVLAQAPSAVKRKVLETAAARAAQRARGRAAPPTPRTSPKPKARGASAAMVDRLALDDKRIEATAAGLETVAALDDPVGQVIAEWQRPNGLKIARVRVPLGVIGIIYESRPERDGRRRGAVLEERQRGDPARRLRERALERGDSRLSRAGARQARPARDGRADGADAGPRGRRHHAARHGAATSTSSCRAAAKVSSRACSRMRACR